MYYVWPAIARKGLAEASPMSSRQVAAATISTCRYPSALNDLHPSGAGCPGEVVDCLSLHRDERYPHTPSPWPCVQPNQPGALSTALHFSLFCRSSWTPSRLSRAMTLWLQ